jgi:2-oxoglutarate dehydrogenase E2 component (dihydrolipoamide succinyltransferase)
MAVSVTMPRLGESVSEGTVTRWLKQEGEQVEADEPLLEVSTDKVDTEIPAPASGVLQSIKVAEDETVEVGVELAVIGDAADSDGGGAAPQQEAEPEQAQSESEQAEAEQESAAEEQPEPEPEEEQQPESEPEPAPTRASQPESESEQKSEPEPAQAQQAAPSTGGGSGDGQSSEPSSDGEAPYVTPLVRRLAAEHSVDLASITGTGVGGRIRKQDVLDAAAQGGARASGDRAAPAEQSAPAEAAQAQSAPAESAPAESAPAQRSAESAPSRAAEKTSEPAPSSPDTKARGRTEKLSRLRTVIAKRMVESLQVSAQLTTVVEVDVTKIARLRERAKTSFEAREGVKLSFLPFFAIATCEALKQHPKVNASIDLEQGTVTYHDAEHLGVAVDTERGLLVPVIHDAGDLNLGGMARKIADLAERTRRNEVTPDELGGGTFTLTNTGSRGALFDTPIINQPQVGILGTGTVVKRPEVVDDPDLGEVIAVRSSMYLALTYDHRIVDGADAARFLTTIKTRLEDGAFEGDLGL